MLTPAELDATLEAAMVTLQPMAETIRRHPNSTIKPDGGMDTASRRAVALLEEIGGRDGSSESRLVLDETIGTGGMGVVHLATQRALGRKVAVKTLRPELQGEAATIKLLHEGWVTGALEHPNVVPVYDIQLDESGRPLIVLKRIEGEAWCDLMHQPDTVRKRFGAEDPLEWNLRILVQVCNAVHFAHSRGIVHRDIKPENVMIGGFGEVYVLDWGIAVAMEDDGSGRLPLARDALQMAGTPCYMAPEMLGGAESRISPRTDVYLLGATLFEMMIGRAPHQGQNLREIIGSVIQSPPSMDGAPEELGRICQRAMEADPDARFENVLQLRLAVEGFLRHRGSRRLAEQADERLSELLALTAETVAKGEPIEVLEERRMKVQALYSECAFGYREALNAWRENDAARDGARRATLTAAEYELSVGDARAAARLLGGLEGPPAELRERIDKAAEEQAKEEARLAQLERDYDLSTGRRTRTFLVATLGTFWTFAPLAAQYEGLHHRRGYLEVVLLPLVFLVVVAGLGLWARDTMSKTIVNQRLSGALIFTFVAQTVLSLGGWSLETPIPELQVYHFFLWFSVAAMTASMVDKRLWPSAIVYGLGFLLATRLVDHRFVVMSVCNLVLTVNAVTVWAPQPEQLFRRTAEEHAELRRRIAEKQRRLRERRQR